MTSKFAPQQTDMTSKFAAQQEGTDRIIAETEAGTPPWRMPWTGDRGGAAVPLRPEPARDLRPEPDAELDAFFAQTGAVIETSGNPRACCPGLRAGVPMSRAG